MSDVIQIAEICSRAFRQHMGSKLLCVRTPILICFSTPPSLESPRGGFGRPLSFENWRSRPGSGSDPGRRFLLPISALSEAGMKQDRPARGAQRVRAPCLVRKHVAACLGDLWMWLQLMWLQFEVVRGPVGVVWGRFGGPSGP